MLNISTGNMGILTDKVRFNVGGKIFETTATTLANAGRNSVFGAIEFNDEYFIDRDPKCFSILLNLLRTGKLHVPLNMPEKFVYEEALYYGLLENVKAAKWGRFDGNKLKLKSSVKGPVPHDCTGCAVSHGSIVDVYNWLLEEQQPLDLHYGKVNDIVVTADQRFWHGYGGMGLFSSSTGDLKHEYEVKSLKTNNVGALCFNSDSKIFACYGETSSESGIGVWDQVTGKRIDSFNAHGSNCLLVSVLFPWSGDHRHISLLDFRDRRMVWSWTRHLNRTEKLIYDSIAMKESNSICVVDHYDNLGFIDWRSTSGSITWKLNNMDDPNYDGISVFSGPDWKLTSSLGRSSGGEIRLGRSSGSEIRDFSIGGDRLFVLHSKENMFDVVRFNVGGNFFETTATTLANAGRNSVFGAMFDDQWNLRPREVNDEYFIDRNPECFSFHVPPNIPEKLFYREALYYGLLDNVRTAKWGRFDGNKLKITSSVQGPAPHGCTTIRASPDGGCVGKKLPENDF
ncbi:hypothetical protein MKX03_021221 [Papaver bracteatum]|nr:hypothetical protein MKX03_021221 [Papaver bracteatum]